MKLKPCGYFVLVEIQKLEEVEMVGETKYRQQGEDLVDPTTGIVLPKKATEIQKHNAVIETGKVVAIGPTAYIGMRGCLEEDMQRTGKPAHSLWGVEIGDTVEFRKYEGKESAADELDSNHFAYRYIPDTHIMGVIENG